MKRFFLSLLSTAVLLSCSSFAAHAQNVGTFTCTSGVNQVNFALVYFNVGSITTTDSSSGTAVKTTVDAIELHTDLSQFPALQPLASKGATLHSCAISGTLPSGLIISYLFKTVTLSSVNAVAHERLNTEKDPVERTKLIGTFTGIDIQVSTPPSPR